jgi:RimJ/RimL family protein N-acetyltransferase
VRGDYHFTPAHEVGWRLAREHWGHGYATEAGAAALAFGFEEIGLDEIVAFAVADNARSRRVMERLGMSYDPVDDFEHVAFPKGHPYRRHVLYRKRRSRRSGTRASRGPVSSVSTGLHARDRRGTQGEGYRLIHRQR